MRNLEHTKISYKDVLECNNELESIRAKLTDAKDVVETIESTIKEAWKGPAATSFYDKLSNLKTDMTNESDSLTSLTSHVAESINSYQNVDMEIIKNKMFDILNNIIIEDEFGDEFKINLLDSVYELKASDGYRNISKIEVIKL